MAGIFSNRMSDTFAVVSGTTSATRRARAATFCSAVLIVAASAAWSWTFGAFSAAVTTPAASGSMA